MLLFAGAHIFGGDVHDAVCVDVKGDFDLGHAAAGRCDPVQIEASQGLVILRHLPLALEHMDLHGGLIVCGGGEDLALLGGDGGVALDEFGHYAAHGLNTQAEGGDVQEQQALHIAHQHTALDGGADGHTLVGVDALEALFAGELFDHLLHGGDTAGAAHQQDLGDVVGGETGVAHGLAHRTGGPLHQGGGELVELGPGEGQIQVLGAGGVGGDIGEVNGGGGDAGELDLGLLGGLLQPLHGHFVAGEVDAVGALELSYHPVHHGLVEVVAAQMGVAGGGQHLDDAVADFQDGHVEGAAAQVVDHDLLILLLLVHAVRHGGGSGLVDDPFHVQAGDLAGILGGLALGVIEVGGDGDDGLGDALAQIGLGVRLQLLQDHGGNLLGCVGLAVDVYLVVGAHLALDGHNSAVGVGDGLALCHLAHHPLAVLGEGHHGRGGTVALCVGDDNGLAALHNSHAGVGRTQVDTDNLRHNKFLQ